MNILNAGSAASVPAPSFAARFCSLLLFTVIGISAATAQCVTPPAAMSCSAPGATPLVNNSTVGTGNTATVTGTSSFSNLTMNGGTLIVCGTLNLSNFTFNSGTIYVAAGGTLNVNTASSIVFGSNSTLYNAGTVYFASSIVTGSNNLIFNTSPTSVFTIPFNQFVLQGPNTQFVNNGSFTSSYFIVQSNNSPGPVCSGPGSAISTGIMINQYANAFTSPVGTSCIQITNQVINSQPMTASPNVQICYMSGAVSISGSPNFGSATVNATCASCSVALPVTLTSVSGTCDQQTIRVSWTVESEEGCSNYHVQRSADGTTFNDAVSMACNGAGATQQQYSETLSSSLVAGLEYVRIRSEHVDGNSSYSDIVQVDCSVGSSVYIYPTFLTDPFLTIRADERIEQITMYGMDGRLIRQFAVNDVKEVVLDLGEDLSIGQYMLSVKTEHIRIDKLLRVL